MSTDLILGTAGHIDHGKTSLIRALTGVDTDRLPEEKRRGITIDIGFAQLELGEYRLGIVDVPGHERFVRNMLAGATGIDLALLVVAADDSVKPQTREHLEILKLLRLRHGVIALTKCDLVEEDWAALVEEEVRELVAGSFLDGAALVRTSAAAGLGLDELKQALHTAATRAAQEGRHRLEGPFRMAIDRTFTIAGHGTVVTGSVSSGRVRLGDELVIEPGHRPVRVRGLQNHDRTVEEVHSGQRAAINLAGVHHEQIHRGHELASPGHLVPSRLITAQLHLLDGAPRPLKHRARVRCHLGTAELLAGVVLLDRDRLEPGQSAPAQLYFNQPAVSTWNQALVLRAESPMVTIGGGQVLDPTAGKLRRNSPHVLEHLAMLRSEEPHRRAAAAAYFQGVREWRPVDLARAAGIADPEATVDRLRQAGEVLSLELSPTRKVLLSHRVLEEIVARVVHVLEALHAEYPLQLALDRAQLAHRLRYLEPGLLEAVLRRMAAAGQIQLSPRNVALAGKGPQLSANEQRMLAEIVEHFRQAGFQPPSLAQLQASFTRNTAAVPKLTALAAAQGELADLGGGMYLHADAVREIQRRLSEAFADGQGRTVSQIREILDTSRKFAVPICEYLDRTGFTRREGDLRFAAGAAVEGPAAP